MTNGLLRKPLELPSGADIPHRIAKAALSENLADLDGTPGPRLERLYRRWADGGAGLIITGNVMVDGRHREASRNVVLCNDRRLDAFEAWRTAAAAGGAKVLMQISHPGRQGIEVTGELVAPSAVPLPGGLRPLFPKPRALEPAEVEAAVAAYARAARLAEQAGFHGVQIHGAHGYLISQFLSPLANRRDDAWGGDAERRRRFLHAVIAAVRAEVSGGFIVALKLNSADFQRGGFDEDESAAVIESLAGRGLDLLEISGGNYETPAMMSGGAVRASTAAREAYFLEFAQKVRGLTDLPLMLTGGFRSRAGMEAALDTGAVDVIGLGRPVCLEPDLPRRILTGEVDSAEPVSPHLPVRLLDNALQLSFFQDQLHRMADGEEPDPALNRWRSVCGAFKDKLFSKPVVVEPAQAPAEATP